MPARGRARRLSQVFLRDTRVADRIVAAANLTSDDDVLEIGPGRGVLTERIAGRVNRLTSIEVDRELAASLQDRFRGDATVEIVLGDAMKAPWPPFTKCVANLPYHLSSALTFRILDAPIGTEAVLLLQREFAQRMVAKEGSKTFGRLSVMTALLGNVEVIERVPRTAFHPVPKVDSMVIRLRRLAPSFPVGDRELLTEVVRLLFSQRRKRIGTVLRRSGPALGIPEGVLRSFLDGHPHAGARPEELSPEKIAALGSELSRLSRRAPIPGIDRES